jgi:hypothetical protein
MTNPAIISAISWDCIAFSLSSLKVTLLQNKDGAVFKTRFFK